MQRAYYSAAIAHIASAALVADPAIAAPAQLVGRIAAQWATG
jgi:hypothetical protein